MATTGDQGVVPQITPQPIIAAAALEFIVAPVALQHVIAGTAEQPIIVPRPIQGVVARQSINPIHDVVVAAQLIRPGRGTAHHQPRPQRRIAPHHRITEAETLNPQRWKGEISLHTHLIRRHKLQRQVIPQSLHQ